MRTHFFVLIAVIIFRGIFPYLIKLFLHVYLPHNDGELSRIFLKELSNELSTFQYHMSPEIQIVVIIKFLDLCEFLREQTFDFLFLLNGQARNGLLKLVEVLMNFLLEVRDHF